MVTTRAGVELSVLEYVGESGTYRAGFDGRTIPASMAVVEALATVAGEDPVDMEPLGATVDTDALDAVVRARDPTSGDVRVAFAHEGYAITVYSYGVVDVAPTGHGRTDDTPADVTDT